MADFLSYSMHQRTERVVRADGVVELSAERWQWLVDYIAANYGDANVQPKITVYEPTVVNGIMFLPAHYCGPDDVYPLAIGAPAPVAPKSGAYQVA